MNCCSHLFEIGNVTPRTPNGCEECLKIGDRWLHLRLCVTCGHVGCCDDSKNKHAAKHFHSTNHPLIKSFEPGEEWGWCYVDELLLESASRIVDDRDGAVCLERRHEKNTLECLPATARPAMVTWEAQDLATAASM
jgi:hypothetical protein